MLAQSKTPTLTLCAVALSCLACVEPDELDEQLPDGVQTWTEFRDAAATQVDGETIYRVEWDLAVSLEELERRYEDYLALALGDEPRSTVNRHNGAVDIWSPSQAQNLSYCVSNAFGANKGRAVNEMATAAAEWEAAADVNFIYDPSQDGNCTGSNPNVLFAVAPWSGGGACAFFPSGNGCVPRTVVMNYTDFDTNPVWDNLAPNLTTLGVFRHELGHVLGLRHEHTRPDSGTCFEDWNWAATTPYDVNSVMHYQWCNGFTQSDMTLTAADLRSVELLYSAPGPEPVLGPGTRVRLRHGSTGKCAYAQGGDGYTVHNWECWSDPNMVFVLDDAGSGRYRLRHEATNQCLYVEANTQQVRHWTCWADPAMRFDLVPEFGGYRLRHVNSGRTLIGHPNDGERVYTDPDAADEPWQVYLVDVLGPATGSWTRWLDRDDAGGSGDWELLSLFNPADVCTNPSAVLCETTNGNSHWWTGETVSCTLNGLACQNAQQSDGLCEDYRVKFYCP